MPTFHRPVDVVQSRRTAEINTVFQTVGAASLISAAECAFGSQLAHHLTRVAPKVNAARVLSPLGAAYLGANFSGATLIAVRELYLDGVHTACALAIASAGIAALMSLAGE